MKAFTLLILFVVHQCLTVSIHATVYPSMTAAPNKFIEAVTGETVSFRWHFNSGDLKNELFEVVFGIWKSPGFLKTKLIAVNSSGFASTRSSYKSSVGWAGNLSSSIAVFELYNVKLKDSKKYGIVVEYGPRNTPLTDSVQLQVKSRRSPEITMTQQRSVTTTARATNTGSPDTTKEPDISVPRKPSEKSSFKWAVACGIIVCVVLTLTAGLYFILRRFFGLPNDIPLEGDLDGNAFPRLKILLERLDRATFGMGIGEGKQVDEI